MSPRVVPVLKAHEMAGPKEHVVDNVVCGCVCPDSERQGENDGYRERGVPAKETKGEAKIRRIHKRIVAELAEGCH